MVRRLSNDFLLPTMITFLNDRDWQTRAAFFREVPCMAAQAGFAGMEAFLLPCVEQASPSFSKFLRVSSCKDMRIMKVTGEQMRFVTSIQMTSLLAKPSSWNAVHTLLVDTI